MLPFARQQQQPSNLGASANGSGKDPSKPYTTNIVQDNRRKFHTTYPHDQSELVEEYDLATNKLVLRKSRRPTVLGGQGEWVYEIGGPVHHNFNPNRDLIAESSTNPVFIRCDNDTHFIWRVRNCFWDRDVYQVRVASETHLIISTTNKKYYKRFSIPDLVRLRIPLNPSMLRWDHSNNTLLISYRKPSQLIQDEKTKESQVAHMTQDKAPRDGDVQCPQQ
mmetsp:Transcript_4207/g.15867  ORF Transcript_4207/g.15867 Transcript_4207/m.15867 type:complete len:221 (-) Transcript_4207:395-1057(-)